MIGRLREGVTRPNDVRSLGPMAGLDQVPRPIHPEAAPSMMRPVSDPVTTTPDPSRSPAAPGARLRVLIVDADRRVRNGLAGLLGCPDELERVEVVGNVGDAPSAVALLDSARPEVLLIDPRLPDVDVGMALVSAVTRRWPSVMIVVMSASAALEDLALARGAAAFVPKSFQADELLRPLLEKARAARVAA